MRNLNELNGYRVMHDFVKQQLGNYGDAYNGSFLIPIPAMTTVLRVIASAGGGWDHVSVSTPDRTPTWAEMQHIHRLFFLPNEIAWEYHVPPSRHINNHPYVLHLWRKQKFNIPMPPEDMV